MIHDKRAVTARVSSAVTVAIMVVLTVAFVAACSLMSGCHGESWSERIDREKWEKAAVAPLEKYFDDYDAWRYQTDTGRRAHD